MTAHKIVAILLDEAEPDHRYSALMLFPANVPRLTDAKIFLGDKDAAPMRVMISREYRKNLQGKEAVDFINDMLDAGYSMLLRNNVGSLILYTQQKRLNISKALAERVGKMGLRHGTVIKLTNKVKPDASGYKTVRAEDVFRAYTEFGGQRQGVDLTGRAELEKSTPSALRALSADELEQLGGISNKAGLAYTPEA